MNSLEKVMSNAELSAAILDLTAVELMSQAAGFIHASQVIAGKYTQGDVPKEIIKFVELVDAKAEEIDAELRNPLRETDGGEPA